MAQGSFALRPVGPYSFGASVRFLEGFAPAAYEGNEAGQLHLAFVADGGEEVAGVSVREEDGVILGEVYGGAEVDVVMRQVERILSLDVDGREFHEVGRRDPVVGRLQARYPGLRPVCFYSPYEAAAWALIGQRIRIVQAARIKASMARELGPTVRVHNAKEHAFPGPERLETLDGFPGLTARKVKYLRHLGREAREGKLDATYLRSLPEQEAHAHLQQLPQNWRPYRTWVTLHLRAMLEDQTGEIASQTKT